MKCQDLSDCQNEATCFFMKRFPRNAKGLRCDAHRVVGTDYYALAHQGVANNVIEADRGTYPPLPPAQAPETAKLSKGWGELTTPKSVIIVRTYDTLCRPCARWHVEDMIYAGNTTVVVAAASATHKWATWLNKKKTSLGFSICTRTLATLGWNRDSVLRTLAGPSLFLERATPPNPNFVMPGKYAGIFTNLDEILGGVRSGQAAIGDLCGRRDQATFFGVHNEPVAGGNVITACNGAGKLRFIVGDVGTISVFRTSNAATLTAAEAKIRALLLGGIDESDAARVAFIPQWAYHIDLQLLYLGRGTFAMHSFHKQQALVTEFFFKQKDLGRRDELHTRIAALSDRFGAIQSATKDILEAQGFTVIDVAGVFPTAVTNGHITNKVLVGHDDESDDQFVVLAYEMFKDTLAEAGFETIGIGTDVQAYMQREEGGLRCRTTTLPTSCVGAEGL
jgi:hypothetical protein